MIKPSELTPHLSGLMAQVIREVFSEDEVAVVEGDAQVAQALQALPFDHVFFTGSPAVGKQVMAAAAQNLTSVTLELGGKSPQIIFGDADMDAMTTVVTNAIVQNAGQTCSAGSRLLVEQSAYEPLLERLSAAFQALRVGPASMDQIGRAHV